MSHRTQYFLLVAPCLLNVAAMFFVAMGAAFGGPQRSLLWPALALLVGGILILAAIAATRATQIGQSSGRAFVSVILSAGFGPLVLLPIGYLAFKPEVQEGLRPVRPLEAWLQPLVLLVLPWVVLIFFGLGRNS
jgi:hypothetical protein